MSSSTVGFATDIIARTGGGILIDAITPDDVEGLCCFLVAKYAVSDIALPARMSLSSRVDEAWHRLMLYPGVYDAVCRRAHQMAASIVGDIDEYPGVVDHSPNAANDPPRAIEQRRRSAIHEMTRLGLIRSSAPSAPHSPSLSGQSRAIGSVTQEAPRNVRARRANDNGPAPPSDPSGRAMTGGGGQQGRIAAEEAAEGRGGEGIVRGGGSRREGAGIFETMQIFVKGFMGKTTTHRVRPQTVFADFMLQYAERTGIPASELRFIGGGKQLEPHLTCAENGLSPLCTLDALLRMRGC